MPANSVSLVRGVADNRVSNMDTCVLCPSPASLCPHCNLEPCCPRHLPSHSPPGLGCLPFTISREEGKGRCVLATRDLAAGDLILGDTPTLLVPPTRTKPQCLQCCLLLPPNPYLCPSCGFPMCGPSCAKGDLHRKECEILNRVNFEAEVEDLGAQDDHYAAILPLRCVQLREQSPDKWRDFQSFLSHCEERKQTNPSLWAFHQEHSVDFVLDTCEMMGPDWTESALHRVVGLMEVNSLEVALPPGHGDQMGFYPVFANINHSCLPNARPHKCEDKRVEVRALSSIKEGEEVTIAYVLEAQPSLQRRQLLNRKWFFSCSCTRCQDPTECGTYLGALLCQVCPGTMLPSNPLHQAPSDYVCSECRGCMLGEEARSLMSRAEQDTRRKEGEEHLVETLERFLDKYSTLLHPTNYVMVTVKMKLGCLYGNCSGYSLGSLSPDLLSRKLVLCQESLIPLLTLSRGRLGGSKWVDRLVKEVSRVHLLLGGLGAK